jgi:hypothetical protein
MAIFRIKRRVIEKDEFMSRVGLGVERAFFDRIRRRRGYVAPVSEYAEFTEGEF